MDSLLVLLCSFRSFFVSPLALQLLSRRSVLFSFSFAMLCHSVYHLAPSPIGSFPASISFSHGIPSMNITQDQRNRNKRINDRRCEKFNEVLYFLPFPLLLRALYCSASHVRRVALPLSLSLSRLRSIRGKGLKLPGTDAVEAFCSSFLCCALPGSLSFSVTILVITFRHSQQFQMYFDVIIPS